MEVKVVSDVHLEKYNEYPGILLFLGEDVEVDIICLCGDIGDPSSAFYSRFLMDCAESCKIKTFVIIGNHECYGRTLSTTAALVQNICNRHERLELLDNSVYHIGKLTFVGTTLWSDVDWRLLASKDFHEIHDWNITKCKTTFQRNKEWLHSMIAELEKSGHDVVVLTHHVPVIGIGSPLHKNNSLESMYASDLTDIIRTFQGTIKLWAYGHNHFSEDNEIYGVRIISNQVGNIKQHDTRFNQHLKLVLRDVSKTPSR